MEGFRINIKNFRAWLCLSEFKINVMLVFEQYIGPESPNFHDPYMQYYCTIIVIMQIAVCNVNLRYLIDITEEDILQTLQYCVV